MHSYALRVCLFGALLASSAPFAACGTSSSGASLADASSVDGNPVDAATSTDGASLPDAATATDAATSLDAADADAFAPAAHVPPPLITSQGGPVIAHPKVVTISFAGYGDDATLSAYGDWIVQSTWLDLVGKEYGVGRGTHTHAPLTTAAPATVGESDVATILSGALSSGAIPAPGTGSTPDTIYMLVMPEGTAIDGFPPCSATNSYAGAYHDVTPSGLVFGIVGQCPGAGFNPVAFAHEFIESATDPTFSPPAFMFVDQLDGEIADECGPVAYDAHEACRVWSNAAASAGIDPCIPAISDPYFSVSVAGATKLTVQRGHSIDVTLTGWSTAPVPTWDMITDVAQMTGASAAAVVPTATLSPTKLNNGETTTLTITAPANADPGIDYDVTIAMGYLPPAPPSNQSPTRHFRISVE